MATAFGVDDYDEGCGDHLIVVENAQANNVFTSLLLHLPPLPGLQKSVGLSRMMEIGPVRLTSYFFDGHLISRTKFITCLTC